MNLTEDLNWLKHHVILLLIVIGLTFGGIYGVETLVARHDVATATHYEAIAADAARVNAQVQAQTQQQIALLAAQNAQLEAQISQLSQAIVTRDAQLLKQQAQIPALTPPQVAANIQPYLAKGTATVAPTGILLDTPASQEVLSQLEELPIRKQDITDLKVINGKQATEISNLSTSIGSCQNAIESEKTSHKADNEANDKKIVALKAQARKSKLKWFGAGVVIGFIGRHFAGF